MEEFLNIQLEDVAGEPPIGLFTLSTNIQGLQTRLSPGWEMASDPLTIPAVLRLLEEQSAVDPGHPPLSVSDDGRVEYRQVQCPRCDSTICVRNGCQPRRLRGFFNTVLDLRLQKYLCRDCGAAFKVDLEHIVPKYGHYSRDVRELAMGYSGGRALSLEESVDLTQGVAGVRPSRETVRLWKLSKGAAVRSRMEEVEEAWSGVYSYDEQYVRIMRRWWYRCLVFDIGLGRPVGDLVLPDLGHSGIKQFLRSSLEGKPVQTLVTDGSTMYPTLIKELFPGASHQLCVIHAMYNARCDFNEAAGIGRESSKPLPDELGRLYGELWGVFLSSKDVKEAEKRFLVIYGRRFDYPPLVRRRLELIAESFVELTEYLVHDDVPRTNNPAEAYFQRTYPERIKRRFRTPEGCQAQISCLDASKGGVDVESGGHHAVLRQIYETFAKLLVSV
jgi:transposase-like protein